jgi:hypothetical protein
MSTELMQAAAPRVGELVLAPSGGDDTPQLQTAVDAVVGLGSGDIVLTPGNYKLADTWRIPSANTSGVVVNVRGIGNPTLRPFAAPPADGLVRVESNWGYTLDGFSLQGPGKSDGVGLWLSHEQGSGTNGGQAILSRINVAGFASGMRVGGKAAASELLLQDCALKGCDIGFEGLDYNTLDVLFEMLSMADNRVGIATSQAGDLHVHGGSASNNQTDFNLTTGGTFSVSRFRSEGARQFWLSGTTTARTEVLLESCEVVAPTDPEHFPVVQGAWGESLTILSCYLSGWVGWARSTAQACSRRLAGW